MKIHDALVLAHKQNRNPEQISRFEHLAELKENNKKAFLRLPQHERQQLNDIMKSISVKASPKWLSPRAQIEKAREIIAGGGTIMGLDLEWSQAGSGFIYEIGLSFAASDGVKTINIMVTNPEDPKVREDNFERDGMERQSHVMTPEVAREYLHTVWPMVDAVCVHGGNDDVLKMDVFGFPITSKPIFNTHQIAEAFYPDRRLRISYLCETFGIAYLRHHVAGNDAEMAVRTLIAMTLDQAA